MKQRILYGLSALSVALVGLLLLTAIGRTAITELSGLAVAQTGTTWKNVKDYLVGDNLTSGVLPAGLMFFDSVGINADRLRGSVTNGILVDVTRVTGNITPADGFVNPTTFLGSFSLSGFFNGTTWDLWRGQVFSAQGSTLLNSLTSGAANTAHVVTLTGVAATRIHLYKLKSACSPAGTSVVSVTDGVGTIYNTPVPAHPMSVMETWSSGLTIPTAANSVITVNACGAGNVGVLTIEADQF